MRNSFQPVLCLALLLTCSSGAFCVALAQAFGDEASSGQNEGDPILPSPKQNNGVYFAPNIATQGSAATGEALSAIPDKPPAGGDGCSAINPCAVVTPALDSISANPDAPPRQAQNGAAHGGARVVKADAQPTTFSGTAAAQGSAAAGCGRRGGGTFAFGGGNGPGRRGGAFAFGQGNAQGVGEGRRGGGAYTPGQGGRRGGSGPCFAAHAQKE